MKEFIKSHKGLIALSAAFVVIVSAVIFHYLHMKEIAGKFEGKWRAAAGMRVELINAQFDVFGGGGSIGSILISDQDESYKPLIYLENVELRYVPFSSYWGPLKIKEFAVAEGDAEVNIIGSGWRVKLLNTQLKELIETKNQAETKAFQFSNVQIGRGRMLIGPAQIGVNFERIAEFPPTNLTFSEDQNKELSDIDEIRYILFELTRQSLEATSYPMIR
ncbi:hypothetical protein [Sneathiella glossodoripedis]|uniref:hypothetical protein n=1 Tax=Sneathiella glossodoripedis TaxID=418853 RepID=UPI00046FB34C|nr:hypothetical protein [Sneathiella glossodoripedis]